MQRFDHNPHDNPDDKENILKGNELSLFSTRYLNGCMEWTGVKP